MSKKENKKKSYEITHFITKDMIPVTYIVIREGFKRIMGMLTNKKISSRTTLTRSHKFPKLMSNLKLPSSINCCILSTKQSDHRHLVWIFNIHFGDHSFWERCQTQELRLISRWVQHSLFRTRFKLGCRYRLVKKSSEPEVICLK